jgi:hypothetical protein
VGVGVKELGGVMVDAATAVLVGVAAKVGESVLDGVCVALIPTVGLAAAGVVVCVVPQALNKTALSKIIPRMALRIRLL